MIRTSDVQPQIGSGNQKNLHPFRKLLLAISLGDGPWDKNARIIDQTETPLLVFGGVTNAIVPFQTITAAITRLIEERKLDRFRE